MADQLCIGLADPEIQEDLLKDPNQAMSVEETIRFVEVRAAGKRSAVTITTPTSTNVETDQGEAINSGYRQQQRSTPTSSSHNPKPEPAHPLQRASQPMPRLLAVSVADRAMGNVPGQPSDGCNAQPSAPLAQPAANPTITHLCAGKTLSERVLSRSQ